MKKLDKLENLKKSLELDKDTIKDLIELKEEEMGRMTKEDKIGLKELYEQREESYNNVLIAIDNIPDAFVLTKKIIKEKIGEYVSSVIDVSGYYETKYFREGFKYGMNLILECIRENKEEANSNIKESFDNCKF